MDEKIAELEQRLAGLGIAQYALAIACCRSGLVDGKALISDLSSAAKTATEGGQRHAAKEIEQLAEMLLGAAPVSGRH